MASSPIGRPRCPSFAHTGIGTTPDCSDNRKSHGPVRTCPAMALLRTELPSASAEAAKRAPRHNHADYARGEDPDQAALKNCVEAECPAGTGTKAYECQRGRFQHHNAIRIRLRAFRKNYEDEHQTAEERTVDEHLSPLFNCSQRSAPFEAS